MLAHPIALSEMFFSSTALVFLGRMLPTSSAAKPNCITDKRGEGHGENLGARQLKNVAKTSVWMWHLDLNTPKMKVFVRTIETGCL